jgi:DNA polymerase III delta subunit
MKAKAPGTQLKELLEQKDTPPCILITSPDSVRRDRALKFLSEHFAKSGMYGRSFAFGESSKESLSSFLQELSEPSLFEPRRFGIIRQLDKAKAADVEPLTRFISAKRPGTSVVAVGVDLPNSQAFRKCVTENGVHIAFEPLKGAELRRWTEREFKHGGVEGVSDEVVEHVLVLASEDPDVTCRIVEKYALFLDGEEPTKATLRQMFPDRAHSSDFELAESFITARRERTEILLHQLFDQGSSPFMLMGLLSKTWSTLLRVRVLSDKGVSSNDIRAHLGISPWLLNKYAPLLKRGSSSVFAQHLDTLMQSDFRLKDKNLGAPVVFSSLAKHLKPRT